MRGGELFLALPWLYLVIRGARRAAPAYFAMAGFSAADLGDGADRLGAPRAADSWRGAEREGTQFRAGGAGIGASDAYLLRRHVLPQTYAVLLTQITLLVPQYVLAEVTLTFLGLGVGEPMPSWGALLSSLAAVLGAFFLLVDVLACAAFDSILCCILRRRRCSAGTSQIRAAVKTSKSLLRVIAWGECGFAGRALS